MIENLFKCFDEAYLTRLAGKICDYSEKRHPIFRIPLIECAGYILIISLYTETPVRYTINRLKYSK
jgi:hypothetical protein